MLCYRLANPGYAVISLRKTLSLYFKKALESLYPDQKAITEHMEVVVATKATFGHFQFNGALALSKQQKQSPRIIAQTIVDVLTKMNDESNFTFHGINTN